MCWARDITGPLSIQAMEQCNVFWDRLADFPLAPDSDDELSWKWTASGGYTASSAYFALHNGATQLNGADRIWKTWAPLRVKFFLWLAVKHRHWTSDRRLRHGLTADPIYRHCDQENESSDHIIFRCSYSLQVWWVFLAPLHFQDITPQAMESLQDWWVRLRSFLPPTKRKGFNTLFSLITWELWKERNARVFRNAATPVPQLVQTISHFGEQWVLAGAKKLGCLFSE